jgi:ribosomal protein S18 acetylase RimI-like enzyme
MFTIRHFAEADFDALVALWHETNVLSYPYVRVHQQHTLADAARFFRFNILVECHVWVAASAAHQHLGLLALSGSWIRQLAVFPRFQRQGIGTALLQRAREHSPRQLRLYTFQRNLAARAFYVRNGFSAVARGVSPAPESEPDIEFCWTAV